jgi:hypothetical protein
MKTLRPIFALAVLVICGMFFGACESSAKASAANDGISSYEQTVETYADAAIVRAIVDEKQICNVADRVTATVDRYAVRNAVKLPDAPSFAIDHVPV